MTALVKFLAFGITVLAVNSAAFIWRLLGVRVAVEDPTGGDET